MTPDTPTPEREAAREIETLCESFDKDFQEWLELPGCNRENLTLQAVARIILHRILSRSALALARSERDSITAEMKALLAFCPNPIVCREGGGPEDEIKSVVLSVARLRSDHDKLSSERDQAVKVIPKHPGKYVYTCDTDIGRCNYDTGVTVGMLSEYQDFLSRVDPPKNEVKA